MQVHKFLKAEYTTAVSLSFWNVPFNMISTSHLSYLLLRICSEQFLSKKTLQKQVNIENSVNILGI